MSLFKSCAHTWRVLLTTELPGLDRRMLYGMEGGTEALRLMLEATKDRVTVLVCCDKCGAKEEHKMLGSVADAPKASK